LVCRRVLSPSSSGGGHPAGQNLTWWVNVKYQIKYADGVFCKQRSDKANALGEINSKNRGIYNMIKEGA
jgi:hypothetical protein